MSYALLKTFFFERLIVPGKKKVDLPVCDIDGLVAAYGKKLRRSRAQGLMCDIETPTSK